MVLRNNSLCIFAVLAIASIGVALPSKQPQNRDVTAWWKSAVFYQIYPRSFMDSDDSGEGDLNGIIAKLDHLKDIGVTSAWLSPIYSSPQVDAGYDISNFTEIDARYGTMEDFNKLVVKARDLDIKIVMDFVPNHSSNESDWFYKSARNVSGFEDFYVWRNGANGNRDPPNNWLSVFKNSAWTYNDIRKQWYLHQFDPAQPDLNYENPTLVKEMKDVLTFWLEKGVYGFRVDAIPFLFETGMEDEPPSNNGQIPGVEHGSLNHIYTQDQDKTYDMVYQFRDTIDAFNKLHPDEDERIMMTEAYTSMPNTMKYYGDGDRLGAHFSFNFQLITAVQADSNAKDVIAAINNWMDHMPKHYTANWVIGNHDQFRVANRVGKNNVDGFNMLVALLPGVGVTYNGEEIGMENGEVTWEQGNDPGACNGPEADFNRTSRDFERTPFQWNSEKNAGFSNADRTWLPVSSKYTTNNLALQTAASKSHYHVYKNLTTLRHSSKVWSEGDMRIMSTGDDNCIVLRRQKEGIAQSHVLLFNMGYKAQNIELSKLGGVWDLGSVVVGEIQVASINSKKEVGALVSSFEAIELDPHESIIISAYVVHPNKNQADDSDSDEYNYDY